jgi:hypothetical protein
MEQRRLRLGDILDDYCPRERRVTNHAIVAMIEADVKQTRCTTCDAEHAYKGGKAPRRRKKETRATLYKEVLEGMPENDGTTLPSAALAVQDAAESEPPHDTAVVPEPLVEAQASSMDSDSSDAEHISAPSAVSSAIPEEEAEPIVAAAPPEDGPVHRPLIRATLPRPEGQKDTRPLPEFTVRHTASRNNGNFRGGDQRMKPRAGQGSNGNRGQRFTPSSRSGGAGRGMAGRGQSGGFRASQPARRGGKKRSR